MTCEVVAIVGNRDFPRLDAISKYITRKVDSGCALVSGGAKGVDKAAEDYATTYMSWRKRVTRQGSGSTPKAGTFLVVRPNYDLYPKRLAPICRNALIADLCTRMVAFMWRVRGGTTTAVRFAHSMGKTVDVYYWNAASRSWTGRECLCV